MHAVPSVSATIGAAYRTTPSLTPSAVAAITVSTCSLYAAIQPPAGASTTVVASAPCPTTSFSMACYAAVLAPFVTRSFLTLAVAPITFTTAPHATTPTPTPSFCIISSTISFTTFNTSATSATSAISAISAISAFAAI